MFNPNYQHETGSLNICNLNRLLTYFPQSVEQSIALSATAVSKISVIKTYET